MAAMKAVAVAVAASALSADAFVVPASRLAPTSGLTCMSAVEAVESKAAEGSAKPTSTDFLSAEALERAKAGNKFEKIKLAKPGDKIWDEIHEFSAAVRSGEYTWEELDIDDADIRVKWAGMFHRRKRHPGTFMVRFKVPNGVLTVDQLRFFADKVAKYDPSVGVMDITTRQNIQIRGVQMEDASDVVNGAFGVGLTTLMSGMDNVRNMVGSPLAGIDPQEMIDTRELCKSIQDSITNFGQGDPRWTNLPRKFNIAVSGGRDDFAHTMINDLGLQPHAHPEAGGEVGFNAVVGGYFSIKRVAESVPLDMWVPEEDATNLAMSMLRIFRDNGARKDRQKARIMWLVEDWGVEKFRAAVEAEMKKNDPNCKPLRAAPKAQEAYARRDITGVHKQKQEGLSWVCVATPAGRLTADDARMIADVAETYSDGEARITVDQKVLFPNVRDAEIDDMLAMPFFKKFPLDAGALASRVVSCPGSQFCGLALMETKNRAMEMAGKLDAELDFPEGAPRIHWTGCPNSCGQAQVGDIGIMGGPARLDGKAVEGVNIFLGGRIGEDHHLGTLEPSLKGIPAAEEHLLPVLKDLCIERFGAAPKQRGGLGARPLRAVRGVAASAVRAVKGLRPRGKSA